jgi:hypothetical protein
LMHCTIKKVVLKAEAQKATSHQKRTVNRISRGGWRRTLEASAPSSSLS